VTMRITAGSGTPVGGPSTVTLAASVAGAPSAKTQIFTLTVTAALPDFTLAVAATPNSTVVNQNVIWNGTLTALHGYNKSVNLSCAGPTPATCSVNPSSLVPSASGAAFTVTVGNATAAAFNFSIQGTDGTTTHSRGASLTVGTDVTWSDTGADAATVEAGGSAIYNFSAAPAGAATFTGTVNFTCNNLPDLTTCAFTPPAIAAGAGTTAVTLTIATTGPYSGSSMPGQHLRPTTNGRPRKPEGNKTGRNAANGAGLLVLTVAGFLICRRQASQSTLTNSHRMLRCFRVGRTASVLRRNLWRRFGRTTSACDCVSHA
jgi:hypothetical protein